MTWMDPEIAMLNKVGHTIKCHVISLIEAEEMANPPVSLPGETYEQRMPGRATVHRVAKKKKELEQATSEKVIPKQQQ